MEIRYIAVKSVHLELAARRFHAVTSRDKSWKSILSIVIQPYWRRLRWLVTVFTIERLGLWLWNHGVYGANDQHIRKTWQRKAHIYHGCKWNEIILQFGECPNVKKSLTSQQALCSELSGLSVFTDRAISVCLFSPFYLVMHLLIIILTTEQHKTYSFSGVWSWSLDETMYLDVDASQSFTVQPRQYSCQNSLFTCKQTGWCSTVQTCREILFRV